MNSLSSLDSIPNTTSLANISLESVGTGKSHSQPPSSKNVKISSPIKQQPRFRSRYLSEIQNIMYTIGDVKQPNQETAVCLEELCHDTMSRLLKALAVSVAKRGAKTIIPEDLLFLLRHDRVKLSRLREYLQWKEVRKLSNSNAGNQSSVAVSEENLPSGVLDELGGDQQSTGQSISNNPKRRPRLAWTDTAVFLGSLLQAAWQDGDDYILDDLDDTRIDDNRHRHADAMTRAMSQADYLEWAECRQASFTYKKIKKFRDWLSPASLVEFRVSDELLEMFGLLACGFIEDVTMAALDVQIVADSSQNGPNTTTTSGDQSNPFQVEMFHMPASRRALSVAQVRMAYLRLRRVDVMFRLLE